MALLHIAAHVAALDFRSGAGKPAKVSDCRLFFRSRRFALFSRRLLAIEALIEVELAAVEVKVVDVVLVKLEVVAVNIIDVDVDIVPSPGVPVIPVNCCAPNRTGNKPAQ